MASDFCRVDLVPIMEIVMWLSLRQFYTHKHNNNDDVDKIIL